MDDLPETIDECLKILDENLEVLSNLEIKLEDEKEDKLIPNMNLHNLYDMAEDVSESSKLKRAEMRLLRRQSENF